MSTKKALVAAVVGLALWIAGGILHGCAVGAEPPSGQRAKAKAKAAAPLEIRAMSYNVAWDITGPNAWKYRRDLVAGILRDERPDSAGLQEASRDQATDLKNALPHLEFFMFDPQTEPVLYDAGRFRLEEAGGFLLFAGDQSPGSRRTCTWLRLVETSTGRAYYHYNVHLDFRSAESRQTSARRLTEEIARRPHRDPVVVTGDFNARESSQTLKFLRGEVRLDGFENPVPMVDTFRVKWPDAREVGTTRTWDGKRGEQKIDYVLVEPATEVLAARIIDSEPVGGRYPSDHLPVTARVRWK